MIRHIITAALPSLQISSAHTLSKLQQHQHSNHWPPLSPCVKRAGSEHICALLWGASQEPMCGRWESG
jgi:hypothetical protein